MDRFPLSQVTVWQFELIRAGAKQGKTNHFLSTAKPTIYLLVPRERIENILDALTSALQSLWFSFFFLHSLVLVLFPNFCASLQSLLTPQSQSEAYPGLCGSARSCLRAGCRGGGRAPFKLKVLTLAARSPMQFL